MIQNPENIWIKIENETKLCLLNRKPTCLLKSKPQIHVKMKKGMLLLLFLLPLLALSQEENKQNYKIIAGARINPLVIYDFEGNREEAVRLHGELGVMMNQKWYLSAGYTPFMNSFYTFNEY